MRDWRAVSIDAVVRCGRLERIRNFLEANSTAEKNIPTWEQDRSIDPFRVAEFRTVDDEVVSANLVSGRTWIVEWPIG